MWIEASVAPPLLSQKKKMASSGDTTAADASANSALSELDSVKKQLAQMQAVLERHNMGPADVSTTVVAAASDDADGGDGGGGGDSGAERANGVASQQAPAANVPRRRIKYSCLFCRDRHQMCDGGKPCGRCRMYSKKCIFVDRKTHKWGETEARAEKRKSKEALCGSVQKRAHRKKKKKLGKKAVASALVSSKTGSKT